MAGLHRGEMKSPPTTVVRSTGGAHDQIEIEPIAPLRDVSEQRGERLTEAEGGGERPQAGRAEGAGRGLDESEEKREEAGGQGDEEGEEAGDAAGAPRLAATQ